MIETFSDNISRYLVSIGAAKEEDREVVAYGLFHILSSALQVFVLVVAGLLLNSLTEFVAYVVCFTSLKRYIGGAHANKHWICLLGFTLMACISYFICRLIPEIFIPHVTIALSSFMVALVIDKAPAAHPDVPMTSAKTKRMRKISIYLSLIQFSAILLSSLILPKLAGLYILCGATGGLSAAVTLILPMRRNKRRREYAKND